MVFVGFFAAPGRLLLAPTWKAGSQVTRNWWTCAPLAIRWRDDMDSYYLNNAVYSAEDVLKKLSNPVCNCQVDYGDRAEHCWNGDHTQPNYISRLRYHQMYIRKWAGR